MAVDQRAIKKYLSNSLNVMLYGLHGTGKTAIISAACQELGYTMAYRHGSTMDVFTELIGIPVPNNETKEVEYYRPREIDDAEVLFIDEINRADDRIVNTVLELVQFRSINGVRLPKLKCVVTAINPATDDYAVEDLDAAMIDRFDVYLEVNPAIDLNYFGTRFNARVAQAVKNWWDDQHRAHQKAQARTKNTSVYLSPRRMEKIVSAYQVIPELSTLRNTAPRNFTGNLPQLKTALDAAFNEDGDAPGTRAQNILSITAVKELESPKNRKNLQEFLEDEKESAMDKGRVITHVASLLNRNLMVATVISKYGYVLQRMTPAQLEILMEDWQPLKRKQITAYLEKVNPKQS